MKPNNRNTGKVLGTIIILCLMYQAAFAIVITRFMDTDKLIKRSKDIIIAECVSIPTNKSVLVNGHWVTEELGDGLYKVEINVIRTLKGDKQPGKQIIATIYRMEPGKIYLLSSMGGSIGETGGIAATDFLAVPELSVVEIPSNFDLKTLDKNELKEQMQSIFSRHLFEVEGKIAPLMKENGLLEKAVADRISEWFISTNVVTLGQIIKTTTTNQGWSVWLDLQGKKLGWSASQAGKNGFLYYQMVDAPRKPYWEFSPLDAGKIEELEGKPLMARFYGMYSPANRGEFGRGGLQSIYLSVGQVLLGRMVDEPKKVYAIQIVGQDVNQERMSVRYAIIQR